MIAFPPGYFDTQRRAGFVDTNQVTVGTTPVRVLFLNPSRIGGSIKNLGTGTVYLGGTSGVTALTGHALAGGDTISVGSNCEVWALSATLTNVVTTFEEVVH